MTSTAKSRSYTRDDLSLFNLLDHPIWVFDIEKKAMWWANTAALKLWNADSLESLLSRNFADDMSEATSCRLADYLRRFRKGERLSDQWTYYPSGKGPTTVYVTLSGIHIEGGRLAMLNEGDLPSVKDEIDQSSLRGVEMLRHLPVAVSQFDEGGAIMHQNPEALDVFGASGLESQCDFLSRFVDKQLGKQVLEKVQNGNDYCVEAQQYTKEGLRWSSIKVRRSKDPVSEKPVILYSARDITEVIQAKKEADEANMHKSEFLAVMGHEIRTPLHQVIGFIEVLSRTKLNKEQSEYVDLLQTSTLSLMTVINDLLDYTKLEAGKMNLESLPFEVRGVVEGSLAVVGPKIEEKGLLLKNVVVQDVPEKLIGDPNRLRQILLNLLQNEIKFTRDGEISLKVTKAGEKGGDTVLRFVVADTGIGISGEHRKHIFDKYRQADASVARNYGGTGLGLAICKCLAETMGGSIGVDSMVGVGSSFWFEIPFKRPPTRTEFVLSNRNGRKRVSTGLRVLVVEDNKVNQKLATAMLKKEGHTVHVVDNGKLALDAVKTTYFDVILMDHQMPVMDGVDATKRIRKQGWSASKLPIVGLTAGFRTADLNYYKEIGMNECLGKPLRLKDLREVLERIHEPSKPPRKKIALSLNKADNH